MTDFFVLKQLFCPACLISGKFAVRESHVTLAVMRPLIIIILVVVIVIALLLLKRAGQTPDAEAQEQLKQGALVIDVRSPDEFASDHLRTAINIPLDEIETALPIQVKDKNQVLLLHCQSGVRSAIAAHKIQGMGYTHASNLGSLSRAKKIVSDAGLQ